jgi:hypothetical protein
MKGTHQNKKGTKHMDKDLREDGRIILAHGEVTGHCHEVVTAQSSTPPTLEQAQFFDGPHGRELVVLTPCVLRHEEHGPIALDPGREEQLRQGDVLLDPTGPGTWRVIRQQEREADGWRQVAD